MTLADFQNIVLRIVVSFSTIFVVTRILGKRQIAELSFFDYVVGITIGGLAAGIIIDLHENIIHGAASILLSGLLAYLVSYASLKSPLMSKILVGEPSIIIQDGNFIVKNLKKNRLSVNKFLELCRVQECFDVSHIKYAIFETTGNVSILLKEKYQSIINDTLNLKIEKENLCANVIIDGKVIIRNLELINKTEKWLISQLKEHGYNNVKNLLLVTINNNGELKIFQKNKSIVELNVLE